MVSYYIHYTINNNSYEILIDAKDIKSAKKKIGRKHGYKSSRKVKVDNVCVIGYL